MKLIYQLKVTLKGLKPPIWRRLEVPADVTFERLHYVLQMAIGWENCHLHQFEVEGQLIAPHDEDAYAPTADERRFRLEQVVADGSRFTYEYDFGDGWAHEILVEKVFPADPGLEYPRCTAGKRACPPEDCGGVWGYADMLEILADPEHEEHDARLEWLGGPFDPEAFDVAETDARLRPGRRRRRAAAV